MLNGKFVLAVHIFEEYIQELVKFPRKKGDYFEVKKQSAHCRRFNMFLDEATSIYQSLASEYVNNKGLLVYVLANLCETNCYFHPDVVFDIAPEALRLSEYLRRPKETAKIYNSLAISNLHNRNFELAKYYIDKSLALNEEAHYPSGTLFALMAKVFWEYAQTEHISSLTQHQVSSILEQSHVYQFLELPLCIMKLDTATLNQLKHKFQWIDFSYTVKQYEKFITSISTSQHDLV